MTFQVTLDWIEKSINKERKKQAGWELEMISQALGHKHLDTTIKYLDWLDRCV